MEPQQSPRRWFKKKHYLIPLSVIGIVVLANLNSDPSPTTSPQVQGVSVPTQIQEQQKTSPESLPSTQEQIAPPKVTTPAPPIAEPPLSNDNHYINKNGDSIHSPAYTPDNSVPAGATARCGDGTYSFSKNHRGTCSHHGGVDEWLD